LKVKGNYFLSPKVFFYDDADNLIEADVDLKSSKEMYVKVPYGVAHSKPIVVQNGTGRTVSKIHFRDRRNMIMDFDEHQCSEGGSGGTIDENNEWRDMYANLLPDGFELPEKCDGNYNQINSHAGNWPGSSRLIYIADYDGSDNFGKSRVDAFGAYAINELTLKFEVYVPKEYPINGAYAFVAFAPRGTNWDYTGGRDISGDGVSANIRVPGTWWIPFKPVIDKSSEFWWAWKIGKDVEQEFFTDGWVTVAIPLSSFVWKTGGSSPMSSYNWLNGNGSDPRCQTPMYKDRLWDFCIGWEPWGDCNQSGPFLCFFDNFRVVPDDGNGMRFGEKAETHGLPGGVWRQY
jgi:hypothetical protein